MADDTEEGEWLQNSTKVGGLYLGGVEKGFGWPREWNKRELGGNKD